MRQKRNPMKLADKFPLSVVIGKISPKKYDILSEKVQRNVKK